MTVFDPLYGELFTAKEVVNLTGFTLNQLRNWRMPSRQDKAPFGFVMIGMSPHYRKVVIDAWVARNGDLNRKYVSVGLDKEFPLLRSLEQNAEKQQHLSKLSSITTQNYWNKWYQDLSTLYQSEWSTYVSTHQRRFYADYIGIDDPSVLTHLNYKRRSENLDQFYYGGVMCARTFYANKQNWDITEDEILAIPVGELPPTKETK